MSKVWQRYAERIDALSLRERVWIFAAAMLLVVAFAYELFIDAESVRQKRLTASIAQRQSEMRAQQAQIEMLIQARQKDPDRENRVRLENLRSRLGELNQRIAAEERKFTAPDQMQAVVSELVARNRGVRLVDLKTLSATSVADLRVAEAPGRATAEVVGQVADVAAQKLAPLAATGVSGKLVFRHGMEVTVSGTYLELLAYLGDLERLPTQLYWGALELAVDEYPRVTMKLTLYTLSLDRAWMSV